MYLIYMYVNVKIANWRLVSLIILVIVVFCIFIIKVNLVFKVFIWLLLKVLIYIYKEVWDLCELKKLIIVVNLVYKVELLTKLYM